ncbi:hypothetical protein ADILRU_1578 [Leifsonia rubra CMS 76R]|nr:hypothetical protein ADILRU_1578 [Leifsonia rubra CMS 76R]
MVFVAATSAQIWHAILDVFGRRAHFVANHEDYHDNRDHKSRLSCGHCIQIFISSRGARVDLVERVSQSEVEALSDD